MAHECGVHIYKSDGSEIRCPQLTDNLECYHHEKYFTKRVGSDGKEHWLSSPAYQDRIRSADIGERMSFTDKVIIDAVYSPRRGVTRRIGHEYDDDRDIQQGI